MRVNHLGIIVKLGQKLATNCQYIKKCTYFCIIKT